MATGFNILTLLVENFWESIYPSFDESDIETRLAPIVSLSGSDYEGTLIQPIHHILITQGNSVGPFALWQYQQAIENSKLTDKAAIEHRKSQSSVFMDVIITAVQESEPQFYQQLKNDLQQAKENFINLNTILEEKCGNETPAQGQVITALDSVNEHLGFILKSAPFMVANTADSSQGIEILEKKESTSNVKTTIATVTTGNKITNREDALHLIGHVADYFKATEPQSPLPYLLIRARDLGRLSFPELLKELVNDDNARDAAYELMGVARQVQD